MSHWTCDHCGGRFHSEHICPKDPDVVADLLVALAERVDALEEEVRELRALVTPLDPGGLSARKPEGDDRG